MPQPSFEITVSVGAKSEAILALFENYSDGFVSRESVIIDWLSRWSHTTVIPDFEDTAVASKVTVAIDEQLYQCLRHHATWARVSPAVLASKIVNDRGGYLYDSRGKSRLT